MPIGSLSITTPSSGDIAGTSGPNELKDIKAQLKASFPNFTTGNDVVTKTAAQLNNSADKTGTETVTGNWTFTGTLNANGTVNFNGSAVVNGSWQFKANAIVADGKSLGLQNSTNTVSTFIYHDGVNLNLEEFLGETDGFQIRDGISLRVYGPGDSQFIGLACNDVNAFLTTNSGSIQVSANGIFDIVDGSVFRIRDAGATDTADFKHDGTDFSTTFTNTGVWDITGVTAINLDGAPLLTQAGRSYSEFERTLDTGAGTGSKLVLNSVLNVKSGDITVDAGAGTATIVSAGEYEIEYSINVFVSAASAGVAVFGVDRNGSGLLSQTIQVGAIGGAQTQRHYSFKRIITLAVSDTINMYHTRGASTEFDTGSAWLRLRRVA